MMGGPQMFSMPQMGGMPAVMNMGMGPMPMGG
jgi:RNA recognition motif-containing protein